MPSGIFYLLTGILPTLFSCPNLLCIRQRHNSFGYGKAVLFQFGKLEPAQFLYV